MGENVLPKLVFWLSFNLYEGFGRKNFKVIFGTPFPIEKVISIFVVSTPHSLKNGHAPKIIFHSYFGKYWFLSPDCTFPPKWLCPPTNSFSQFFQLKLKNIRAVFLLKSVLIRKKILWIINFVFTKFSPNVLFFGKLQNECTNPSFLHNVTCIRSDHAGSVAKFHIHGFIL